MYILTCTTCIDKTIIKQDEAIRQKDAHISCLMKRTHLPAMDTLVGKVKSTEVSTDTSSDIIISSM